MLRQYKYYATSLQGQVMAKLVAIIIFLFSLIVHAHQGPSFNCEKALSSTEKAICASPDLSALDFQMAVEYRQFVAGLPASQKVVALTLQRLWLKHRASDCKEQVLTTCLQEKYESWQLAIKNGALLAVEPITANVLLQDPFDPSIQWQLNKVPEPDDADNRGAESSEYVQLNVIKRGKKNNIAAGSLVKYSNIEYQNDIPTHLYYYLTAVGKFHRAYLMQLEGNGGRCYSSLIKTLKFISNDVTKEIGEVNLLDADYACDTYEKTIRNWKANKSGQLEFFYLDFKPFYYQIPFFELMLAKVDSEKNLVEKGVWVDQSATAFDGIAYTKIFNDIYQKIDLEVSNPEGVEDESCVNSIPDVNNYLRLKEVLGSYAIGFQQLQFIASNVLQPGDLEKGKIYKPLIQQTLLYLNKARAMPDWKAKLQGAAKKFPDIQATANYYYDFEMPLDVDPFVDAGFYTDKNCYAVAKSPLQHASLEEWIYLFWARRIGSGNLDVTEKLLIKALQFIK